MSEGGGTTEAREGAYGTRKAEDRRPRLGPSEATESFFKIVSTVLFNLWSLSVETCA